MSDRRQDEIREMIISRRAVWIVADATVRGTLIARTHRSTGAISYALREKGTRGKEIAISVEHGRAIEQMIDSGAAGALARRSNLRTTQARAEAARINGRKGGRPRKHPRPDES